LSRKFADSLNELIKAINESHPRFIRCIKPNSTFSSTEFDSNAVAAQLRSAGMLEAIRIRKMGYPIRDHYDNFLSKNWRILALCNAKSSDSKELAQLIF
jgi:myosin heavy subunit